MPNTPNNEPTTDEETEERIEELVDPAWRPPVASHSDPIDVRSEYAEDMGEWRSSRRGRQ